MTTKSREGRGEHLVKAPRDFFLAPVFAATPQTGAREVTVSNRRYTIGGLHPMHRTRMTPALDVRHFRTLLTLLSFRDPFDPTRIIPFSMNEFCCRYAHSQGGRYARDIADRLADLMDTYFNIFDLLSREGFSYRIIERVEIHQKPIRRKDDGRVGSPQSEMWLESATLSQEFAELLDRIEELHHVKLSVFTSIRSPLAQSIYLYIPSRAHHHTAAAPFEITLTNLLQQVSHPVPEYKSKRHQLFNQHKTSIISQLNGKETLSGVFRVRLAKTSDGQDWKLQCWVEKPDYSLPLPRSGKTLEDSKMVRAFIASGKTLEEAKRRINNVPPFTAYERELFSRANINLAGNEKAFELARALLGEGRFDGLLAEAKGDALERRPATKSPNHRLMSRIMEALRTR